MGQVEESEKAEEAKADAEAPLVVLRAEKVGPVAEEAEEWRTQTIDTSGCVARSKKRFTVKDTCQKTDNGLNRKAVVRADSYGADDAVGRRCASKRNVAVCKGWQVVLPDGFTLHFNIHGSFSAGDIS